MREILQTDLVRFLARRLSDIFKLFPRREDKEHGGEASKAEESSFVTTGTRTGCVGLQCESRRNNIPKSA